MAALEDVHAEDVDRGALAGTGYARDTDADGVSGVWQAALDDLLGLLLVFVAGALDQCDGLAEDGGVTAEDAFDKLRGGESARASGREVGTDSRRVRGAAVHLQPFVFLVVLRMIHVCQ